MTTAWYIVDGFGVVDAMTVVLGAFAAVTVLDT